MELTSEALSRLGSLQVSLVEREWSLALLGQRYGHALHLLAALLFPFQFPLEQRHLGAPRDLVDEYLVLLPVLLLVLGLLDHLLEFLLPNGLHLLALQEFELHRHSDVELALALLGDEVLFVLQAILNQALELLEILFLEFLLLLRINLRESLLCHGQELDLLLGWADVNVVVALKPATLAKVAQELQPRNRWLLEIV